MPELIQCRQPADGIVTTGRVAVSTADAPRTPVTLVGPDPDELYLVFEQYDGPFVGIRYLTDAWSGENRGLYSFSFLGMTHSHEAGLLPLSGTTNGLVITRFSGQSTYDPVTGTYSGGGITVSVEEHGAIPGGSNYVISARPFREVTKDTVGQAQAALNYGLIYRSVSSGIRQNGDFVTKYYSETPGPAFGGFFVAPVLSSMWSDGWTVINTQSNLVTPEQLGIPVARTGVPARTQHVLTYNASTNTYTGTRSRVTNRVAIPVGKTKLYADYTFLVTPDNGDPAYTTIVSREYDVTPSTNYEPLIDFPWIVAATVYYVTASFSFFPSYFYNFADLDGEYTEFPVVSTWPELTRLASPAPNGDCWDDFEAGTADNSPLIQTVSGYGWAEAGQFHGTSDSDVYEDFESYALGTIAPFTLGVGWAGPGVCFSSIPDDAYDDFESYALGALAETTLMQDFWLETGKFVDASDVDAYEDYESYALGALAATTYNPTGYWAANGVFF